VPKTIVKSHTNSTLFNYKLIDKDAAAAAYSSSDDETVFDEPQSQSQFKKTKHTRRVQAAAQAKKTSRSSQPLQDSSNMAGRKARPTKAQKEAEKAAAEAKEAAEKANAENEKLRKKMAAMKKQLAEKSGRPAPAQVSKSSAPVPKSSSGQKKRSLAPTSESVAKNSKPVAQSSQPVAKKIKKAELKQGHLDANSPQTPMEVKIQGLLEAKRMYGICPSLSSKSNKKQTDETNILIHGAIQKDVFDVIKYVLGEKGTKKLCDLVLENLKWEGFHGEGPRVEKNKAEFFELYWKNTVSLLNNIRSTAASECKKAAKIWWDENLHKLPSNEDLDRLISRDLDIHDDKDYLLFEWYQMHLVAKATGSSKIFDKKERARMTLSKAAIPKSKRPYITPQTEAYAVLLMKGNHSRWLKMFEINTNPKWSRLNQCLLGKEKQDGKKKKAKKGKKDDDDDDDDDDEEEEVEEEAVDKAS